MKGVRILLRSYIYFLTYKEIFIVRFDVLGGNHVLELYPHEICNLFGKYTS